MNKETIQNISKNISDEITSIINNQCYINDKTYYGIDTELIDYIRKLEYQENNKQQRIDKAIEYIHKKKYQPSPLGFELELNPKELYNLLSILKGENNE